MSIVKPKLINLGNITDVVKEEPTYAPLNFDELMKPKEPLKNDFNF